MDPLFAFKDLYNESVLNIDSALIGNINTPAISVDDITEFTSGHGINLDSQVQSLSILPQTTSLYNLGSLTKKWNNLFLASALSIPSIELTNTSNQIKFGSGIQTTLNATIGSSNYTITIPDPGMASTVILSNTSSVSQNINTNIISTGFYSGIKSFLTNTSNQITMGTSTTTTINSAAPSVSRIYTLPDVGTDSSFVMTNGIQTVDSKTLTNVTISSGTISVPTINAGNLNLTNTSNQIVLGSGTTTTINSTSPVSNKIYTIPDTGVNSSFVMTDGIQTINDQKTFSSSLKTNQTSNQIILGSVTTTTINSTSPVSNKIYTIPDTGANSSFVMTDGIQTINDQKTFSSSIKTTQTSNQIILGSVTTTTINSTTPISNKIYTIPDTGANSSFVMTDGIQTINDQKTFSSSLKTTQTSNQISLGNTNIMVFNAAVPSALLRTINFQDVLADSNVILSEGAQTMNGIKTFTSVTRVTNSTASSASNNGCLVLTGGLGVGDNIFASGTINGLSASLAGVTNQLVLGSTRTVTITAPTPGTTSRTMTIQDVSSDANFVLSEGTQTINGTKTLSGITTISNTTDSSSGTTGSLIISGGLGIAKKTYTNSGIIFNTAIANPDTTKSNIHSKATNLGLCMYGPDLGGVIQSCLNGNTSTEDIVTRVSYNSTYLKSVFSVLSDLDVQSASDAALVCTGGIIAQKQMRVGTSLNVVGTTDSSSTTTGAIVCSGGVGIAKTVHVGVGIVFSSFTSTLATYSKEAFNTTLAGALGTAAPACNGYLERTGDTVSFRIPQVLATSSSSASITWTTNLPATYRPSQQMDIPIAVDNNGTWQMGIMRIPTGAANIQIYATLATGNFTSGVTIGFLGTTVHWSVN